MKKTAMILLAVLLAGLCLTSCTPKKAYMTNKNICTQDEYEKTLFGQPISVERNGEIRLGIKCTHDIYADLTIYEAKDGKYEPIFNCPAVIGQNGPGKHAEGDTKTPLGTWVIGEAYGIKENPGALLPYTQVTEDMYWCATGSHGDKYNQLIYKSDDPNADYSEDEHLIEYPGVYDYFIDLGYNKGCAPYAGNAIFLGLVSSAVEIDPLPDHHLADIGIGGKADFWRPRSTTVCRNTRVSSNTN